MHIKNILSYAFVSALFIAPLANAVQAPLLNTFDGFYIDGAIGGINSDYDINQIPQILVPTNFNILPSSNSDTYKNSVIGALGVGFNKTITNNFLIGIQGVADIQNGSVTHFSEVREVIMPLRVAGEVSTKLKNSFALLFTPGFVLDANTLVYGLIGPRWGNFESSLSAQFTAVSAGPTDEPVNAFASSDNSSYNTGISIGLGISRYVTDNVSIGAEYTYTNYGHISAPADVSTPIITQITNTNIGTLSNTTEIRAKTNALLVNVAYHFN